MKKFKLISDGNLLGESPIWNSFDNEFIWSDIISAKVYKYIPEKNKVEEIASGKNVSGIGLMKQGSLLFASHQGIFIWDKKNGFQFIADKYMENQLFCNDTIVDAAGRFLFGTTFYGPESRENNYELGKLYKIDLDGSISILDEGVHLSNGLGFSTDNKTLYYTDSVLRHIYTYDYDLNKGLVSNRRIFVKVPDEDGIPDGLTVDAEGYIWSAQWYGSCIVRYDPDGNIDREIKTPMKQTSSLMFGGKDLKDIYITSAGQSMKLSCAPEDYDFDSIENIGGQVLIYHSDKKGRPENFIDIKFKL